MTQLTISKQKLHRIFMECWETDETGEFADTCITEAEIETVNQLKEAGMIEEILTTQEMSADRIGGDDVISYVDGTLAAIRDGFEIGTWYGPDSETLIVGFKPGFVVLTDELDYTGNGDA